MLMVLQVGLTIKQSIRLGSLSLPTLAVIFWLAVLLRSTSTWISFEVTMTGLSRDSVKVASWETRSGLVWRRRRGRLGFRSHCCWQPFRISFRLGELSRLNFKNKQIISITRHNSRKQEGEGNAEKPTSVAISHHVSPQPTDCFLPGNQIIEIN